MRFILLLILVTLFAISTVQSQEQKLVKFFDTIMENNIDGGFKNLLSETYFRVTDSGKENEKKIIDIYKAIDNIYGKIEEYEKHTVSDINKRIRVYEYFTYHKYSPVYWKFILYNNNNKWIVINLEINYDLDSIPLK